MKFFIPKNINFNFTYKDFLIVTKYIEYFILYNIILFVILIYYDIINVYVLYDLIYDNTFNIVINVSSEMVHTFAPSDIKLYNSFFDKFIYLFKSNSSFKYFPSYFVDVPCYKSNKKYINTLEPLFYGINNQRLSYIYELESLVNEMCFSIKQYKLSIN